MFYSKSLKLIFLLITSSALNLQKNCIISSQHLNHYPIYNSIQIRTNQIQIH